ncbi:MAG: hypothetical protein FJY85_18750 [Deltaproteobacteria bacterium]|nr:hypothetical protein [Deltaproteobacteria bacterium]
MRTYDVDYYETQFKVLQSETLAEKVIAKLGLKNSPEFHGEEDIVAYYANPATWFRLLKEFLTPLLTPPRAEPTKADGEQLSEEAEEQELLKEFLKRLRVKPLTDTRIAIVTFEGYDP